MAESSYTFLFRSWQEQDGDGELSWRFSLTYINGNRERKGFTSLEAVFAYLQRFFTVNKSHATKGKQP